MTSNPIKTPILISGSDRHHLDCHNLTQVPPPPTSFIPNYHRTFNMTTHEELYNGLSSVEDASYRLGNPKEILEKLTPVFEKYGDKFGVCLVHRHCTLDEGEKMVADGDISQPERDIECYPERWLASGEPYEFTRKPTESPPLELLEKFKEVDTRPRDC